MKIVLLSTSARLRPALIEDARSKLQTDVSVDLVSYSPASPQLDGVVRSHVVTGVRSQPATIPQRATRKLERTKPGRALRRLIAGGLSRRMWTSIRRNPAAMQLLTGADLVIAMDTASIRSAWHIAKRNRSAVVVYGAQAAARPLLETAARLNP